MTTKNKNKIAYIVPGLNISGGIAVVLQHVNRLKIRGYDVELLNCGESVNEIKWFENHVPIINVSDCEDILSRDFDIVVATYFGTIDFVKKLSSKRKIYFVQSDERRFNPENVADFKVCTESYKDCSFEFMTEAIWIQRWLKEEFGHDAYYVPNGLDEKIIHRDESIKRESNRARVLLEGPIDIPFKGMVDSYNAVKDLDCDIWIVSSGGKPDSNWRYNEFFEKVPFDEMKKMYSSCDIFLKMSRVEGFFGPPMEAMACGCAVVVGEVTGYDEYIKNEHNALVVKQRDVKGAKTAVQELINDKKLRKRLVKNGYKTASEWNWDSSIDLLENVIRAEKPKVFYTENAPKRYDYKSEIRNLLLNTVEKMRKERDENIRKSNRYQAEIEIMKNSFFWKLRGRYLKTKSLLEKFVLTVKKFFKKSFYLLESFFYTIKNEGIKNVFLRVYNFVIYGKGVLKKKELNVQGERPDSLSDVLDNFKK